MAFGAIALLQLGSALLKAPLRIEGEYQRPDGDTLVRQVRAPYAETTTLRQGEATIASEPGAGTTVTIRLPRAR